MTSPPDDKQEQPEDLVVRDLVRRALAADRLGQDAPDVRSAVQRRIRRRSRGKFFGDGWSTGQARLGYVLVGVITLLLVAVAYFGLAPIDVR
jgi:hypothetical protein